jgi:hypothetical protein
MHGTESDISFSVIKLQLSVQHKHVQIDLMKARYSINSLSMVELKLARGMLSMRENAERT